MRDSCYNQPMRKIPAFIALTLPFLLFASCATSGRKEGRGDRRVIPVYITDSKAVTLLAPACMDGILDELQLFTGFFGEQSFSSLAYIQADQGGIGITLLNEMGMDMGSLSYDGKSLSFSSPYFPKDVRAEYIVLDIQNAYYELPALASLYDMAGGLSFSCELAGAKEIRRILDGNSIIEEIVKDSDAVSITNFLRGYRYELRKVEE